VKNAWKLLLPVPCLVAFVAMVPQGPQGAEDPAIAEVKQVVSISALQYTDRTGKTNEVPSRNVLEIRLLEDFSDGIRLEVTYENGDYSLIDAQALHILRSGPERNDVQLVRGRMSRLRFPKLGK
jgi:hypothetical protein